MINVLLIIIATATLLWRCNCQTPTPRPTIACPTSTLYDGELSACSSCRPGKYADYNQGLCIDCAGGFYSSSQMSSSCQSCPAGQYSAPGATTCLSTCPAGAVPTAAEGPCKYCEGGKYAYSAGQTITVSYSAANTNGVTQNYASTGPHTVCSAFTATMCASGGSSSGDTYLRLVDSYGNTLVTDDDGCGNGGSKITYNPSSCTSITLRMGCQGSNSCSGTVALIGTAPAASETNAQKMCVSCAAGTYSYGKVDSCSSCQRGYYSNKMATSCTACSAGSYTNREGAASCTACGAGTYASSSGSASCTLCPASTYSSAISATSASTCITCRAGEYALEGSASCTQCDRGKYSTSAGTSSSACLQCPLGKYSDIYGTTTCTSCPAGKTNAYVGATSSSSCQSCPAGTYVSEDRTSCVSCDRGKYSQVVGATGPQVCTQCPTGSYSSNTGASSCTSCPAGKYSNKVGSVSSFYCFNCRAGYYSSAGMSTCSGCSANSFSVIGKSYCTTCPGGSVSKAASGFCAYSSRHPYLPNEDYLSPQFSLSGVSKYSIQIVNTSLEYMYDFLYILDGNGYNTLYTYSPTVFFRGQQFINIELTSSSGIRVKFRSDSSEQQYGYEIRISPASTLSSSSQQTFTKVSLAVQNVPRKTADCDEYFMKSTGKAVNTFAPGGSAAVVTYEDYYKTNAAGCAKTALSLEEASLSFDLQEDSTNQTSLSLKSASSSSSPIELQDGTINLTFDVIDTSITLFELENQFKIALENGELESIIRSSLEDSGNPMYLQFSKKMLVLSVNVESPTPSPTTYLRPTAFPTDQPIYYGGGGDDDDDDFDDDGCSDDGNDDDFDDDDDDSGGCSSDGCFPGDALVTLEDGSLVEMRDLKIGQKVMSSPGVYSEVYLFTHALSEVDVKFVELHTENGLKMRLTGGHYIFVNQHLVPAASVKLGDILETGKGLSPVTSISLVEDVGLYNPHTLAGDLMVNGIHTSTYTEAIRPSLAHALLAPVRHFYPFIAKVSELLRIALFSEAILLASALGLGLPICCLLFYFYSAFKGEEKNST